MAKAALGSRSRALSAFFFFACLFASFAEASLSPLGGAAGPALALVAHREKCLDSFWGCASWPGRKLLKSADMQPVLQKLQQGLQQSSSEAEEAKAEAEVVLTRLTTGGTDAEGDDDDGDDRRNVFDFTAEDDGPQEFGPIIPPGLLLRWACIQESVDNWDELFPETSPLCVGD